MASLFKEEDNFLAPYATKCSESKGRQYAEKDDPTRLCFQRDRNRIIHCKAFRRLEHKTQVFMAGSGDHYRTRLTHTLEVAQISRSIARRLGLNEDLCEAIALAHDLGHPPHGHAGEEALNSIMQNYGLSFEHNEQSRRVVETLEKAYPDFPGLNLTFEVLDGLIKHQTAYDQEGKKFEVSAHLEAQVVNVADEIAYTNHDMDDGLRSGMITLKQLKKLKLWQKGEKYFAEKYIKTADKDIFVRRVIGGIMGLMIDDLCENTMLNIKKRKIKSVEDVKNFKGLLTTFGDKMKADVKELRNFLYMNFYFNPKIEAINLKGKRMIKKLFEFYVKNPKKFPDKLPENSNKYIKIKDYIAGMTDNFLKYEYLKMIKK